MKFSQILNKIFTPFRIANVWNIPIYLHWSWWMSAVLLLAVSPSAALLFITLGFIVFLHELGHCWAIHRSNLQVKDIMLYLIGGVARYSGNLDFKKEIFVTICGPLVNVALLPILSFISYLTSGSDLGYFVERVSYINLIILIFNLIPAFPLDGGRILRAFLWSKYGLEKGTRFALVVANIFSLIMAVVGIVIGNFSLLLIALFLYYTNQQENYKVSPNTQNALEESQKTLSRLHDNLEKIRENHLKN